MKKSIQILYQKRHQRLNEIIKENITSNTPVLIYCPIATELQRVKFSNIYIAPDTEGVNYAEHVEALLLKQNQIYYPLYLKIKRFFNKLFKFSKNDEFSFELVN